MKEQRHYRQPSMATFNVTIGGKSMGLIHYGGISVRKNEAVVTHEEDWRQNSVK